MEKRNSSGCTANPTFRQPGSITRGRGDPVFRDSAPIFVSLDLQTTLAKARAAAAKAEAARWESEARNRESRTKARVSAIDLMESILAQGVRAQDLPHRAATLITAGMTAEELSGLLEQYGSPVEEAGFDPLSTRHPTRITSRVFKRESGGLPRPDRPLLFPPE